MSNSSRYPLKKPYQRIIPVVPEPNTGYVTVKLSTDMDGKTVFRVFVKAKGGWSPQTSSYADLYPDRGEGFVHKVGVAGAALAERLCASYGCTHDPEQVYKDTVAEFRRFCLEIATK
jgi:hypothetical protein